MIPWPDAHLIPPFLPQNVLAEDLKATDLEVGIAETSNGGLFRSVGMGEDHPWTGCLCMQTPHGLGAVEV